MLVYSLKVLRRMPKMLLALFESVAAYEAQLGILDWLFFSILEEFLKALFTRPSSF